MWMDGALIGFSFLSLWHPRLNFFLCLFLAMILGFFLRIFFFPHRAPSFSFFDFETFSSQLLPPIVPHQFTHLYI
jgi:hypothetical protein